MRCVNTWNLFYLKRRRSHFSNHSILLRNEWDVVKTKRADVLKKMWRKKTYMGAFLPLGRARLRQATHLHQGMHAGCMPRLCQPMESTIFFIFFIFFCVCFGPHTLSLFPTPSVSPFWQSLTFFPVPTFVGREDILVSASLRQAYLPPPRPIFALTHPKPNPGIFINQNQTWSLINT